MDAPFEKMMERCVFHSGRDAGKSRNGVTAQNDRVIRADAIEKKKTHFVRYPDR